MRISLNLEDEDAFGLFDALCKGPYVDDISVNDEPSSIYVIFSFFFFFLLID